MINYDTFILLQTMIFSILFQFYQMILFHKKMFKLQVYLSIVDQILKKILHFYFYTHFFVKLILLSRSCQQLVKQSNINKSVKLALKISTNSFPSNLFRGSSLILKLLFVFVLQKACIQKILLSVLCKVQSSMQCKVAVQGDKQKRGHNKSFINFPDSKEHILTYYSRTW